MYSYFFNLVLLTWKHGKLLPNLELEINLGYSNNYKFGGNNIFFSDFNNVDL